MSSYVSLANRAAITVGTSARLTSPTDNTVLGRAVASVWDTERKAALRDGAWNFAMKRTAVPALAEAPSHSFALKCRLPTDCLRLIEVYEIEDNCWQLEGREILTDGPAPLKIRYLADITEPAEFDPLFAQAFALRLAGAIGNRIAGSVFKEEVNWEKYQAALRQARMSDAMENPGIKQAESSWITGRITGRGGEMSYENAHREDWW